MECDRLLAPYYKYGIFLFCGIELVYSALVMAINQKFWDLSSKIFPIAYRMFNDTLFKGEPDDFKWGADEMNQLNTVGIRFVIASFQNLIREHEYQEKLKVMWLSSTLVVIFSMLCIVPQFCTTENAEGNEVTYCVKKPLIGQSMAPILIVLILGMGAVLTWQWATCEADADLFQQLFRQSQKEESFLSEFERQLNCILDDDKEIDGSWECDNTIDRSMLNERWMNPLFYAFFISHTAMFIGLFLMNKDGEVKSLSVKDTAENSYFRSPQILNNFDRSGRHVNESEREHQTLIVVEHSPSS